MTDSAATDPIRQASKPYDELLKLLRDAATLSSVQTLLGWDQETIMPPAGAALRADQLAGMSGVTHRAWTSPRIGELLAACEADGAVRADEGALANVREARREFERATKLPTDLVEEMARTFSLSIDAWKDARARSDFAAMAPWLEKIVALNRRKAEFYGVPKPTDPGAGETTVLYDALLDEYEPGMTAWRVERVFKPLRARLTPLIAAIASAQKRPSGAILETGAPLDAQIAFNRFVAEAVGFDFNGGRLDVSAHPFSETVGPGDIRMTTRYSEERALDSVFTTLHESGHSLYEQGLPKAARFGQPLATYISLGIHESQSRMWENFIGRSPSFWKWALPNAARIMGPAFAKFSLDQAYGAANLVKPHFIRVESDEATYNLHIMLRFDLERALISGDLKVKDLPGAWNDRMKSDLGLTVTDDKIGCLQDIHWSMGAIGYFSTYSLGNCYAAQFWETMQKEMPDMERRHERGEFAPTLAWLTEKIHRHGRRWRAEELCKRITGQGLGHEALVRHLEGKLKPIYGL